MTSKKVCSLHNDANPSRLYYANMASKTRPKIQVIWFLREWMDTLRVNQAKMCRRTDWSKTTASHLYNSQQDMNVDLLKDAARALHVHHYELLMHPDEAMAIRRMREDAVRIAADSRITYNPPPTAEHQKNGTEN